jgi:hypothetical protein
VTGAEIFIIVCILPVKNEIKIIALIHDAIFLECDEKEADETIYQPTN